MQYYHKLEPVSENHDCSVVSRVEFAVASEQTEALEELLIGQGYSPVVVQSWPRGEPSQFTIYPSSTTGDVKRLRHLLAELLAVWGRELGIAATIPRIGQVQREDWAESWKLHFRPLRIGRSLIIKPSWARVEARHGERIVELDPGMSFGTGQHGTTLACLQIIEKLIGRHGAGLSFLDAGCGSGILALAAAALGCRPVVAFDCDHESVRVARENIAGAGMSSEIELRHEDLTAFPESARYRLVVANILAPVLLGNSRKLFSLLVSEPAVPAYLIVSGILDEQYAEVRDGFSRLGLREVESRLLAGWRTGCLVRETRG